MFHSDLYASVSFDYMGQVHYMLAESGHHYHDRQQVCPHVPAPSSIQPHVQGEGEREPLMPYTGGPPFCGHTQAVWRLLLARALVGGLFSVEPAQ